MCQWLTLHRVILLDSDSYSVCQSFLFFSRNAVLFSYIIQYTKYVYSSAHLFMLQVAQQKRNYLQNHVVTASWAMQLRSMRIKKISRHCLKLDKFHENVTICITGLQTVDQVPCSRWFDKRKNCEQFRDTATLGAHPIRVFFKLRLFLYADIRYHIDEGTGHIA